MSHGSYDLDLGSEILILGRDIRSRSWPNIGDSYGNAETLRKFPHFSLSKKNSFCEFLKSKRKLNHQICRSQTNKNTNKKTNIIAKKNPQNKKAY
jgi:hypothetical protein